MNRHLAAALAFAVASSLCASATAQAPDPLPSWNDGKARQSIIEFVATVTKEGFPDLVPPAERIAVFDRVKALAPRHPEWRTQEPFASVLEGDVKSALSGGEHALLDMVMATHAGMTTEEFENIVTD